ncbi:MAG: LysR family transcriptional regulator [Hyphomicrobiales bacterium]|nr:LysR family transcriptional regulator [Hyphomicrobiales bacterium]MDE2017673.1 LysR family transcriptional regulator [Hyphomicrobiales bacterium]
MRAADADDLLAFLAIARERSFTRAAAKLGVSPSALSHRMRAYEARLGLRLLARTTRSVATTEAGERLIEGVGARFEEIDDTLARLTALRDRPAGALRLTAGQHAAETLLWPALKDFLRDHPDVSVELSVEDAFVDLVAGRFDAGVRLGDDVARDMVAVPIGPPVRFAVVGAPDHFARRGKPRVPQDLVRHDCINLRLPTLGAHYAWEFEKAGRQVKVRVEGRVAVNRGALAVEAAIDGLGLAYAPEDRVRAHLAAGRLERVLADWCPAWPGLHLYYPSRRQPSPAFAALLAALRRRVKKSG